MVLYWMLNNRKRPFIDADHLPTHDEIELAQARREKGDPLPRPKYGSRDLQNIVLKACAYAPKDRFSSAREMYQALEVLQSGGSIPELPKPEPPGKPKLPDDEGGLLGGWISAEDGKENGKNLDDEDEWSSVHVTEEKRNIEEGPAVLEGAYPDEQELKTIKKVLNICTVIMGICTFGIALLWCIPIRKKILNRIDRREPISDGLKIAATMIGLIPGLLLLVNEDI